MRGDRLASRRHLRTGPASLRVDQERARRACGQIRESDSRGGLGSNLPGDVRTRSVRNRLQCQRWHAENVERNWPRTRWRSAPRTRNSRSEEHTSELQSRVDISYAVFCLKKK